MKQGGAVFAFNLKNAQGQEQAWHIDLKETGKVGKGAAPEGKKADGKMLGRIRSSGTDADMLQSPSTSPMRASSSSSMARPTHRSCS